MLSHHTSEKKKPKAKIELINLKQDFKRTLYVKQITLLAPPGANMMEY